MKMKGERGFAEARFALIDIGETSSREHTHECHTWSIIQKEI